jgi:hypothetical protein
MTYSNMHAKPCTVDAWVLDPRGHEAIFRLSSTSAAKGNRAEATQLQRVALRLLRWNMGRRFLGRAADIGAGTSREFRSAMTLGRWLTKRSDSNAAIAALERAHRAAPKILGPSSSWDVMHSMRKTFCWPTNIWNTPMRSHL